ncbi:MAG: hypothetical protein ABIA66_00270 [Candidatus Omnitrophota bacterium]
MMKKQIKRTLWISLCLGLFVCQVQAAQEDKPKSGGGSRVSVKKEIQGEVTGKTFESISICYSRDKETRREEEIMIPIDEKSIKLVNKQELDEIKIGDVISVEYDEIIEDTDEGKFVKRKGQTIHFIRPAANLPESDVLQSAP